MLYYVYMAISRVQLRSNGHCSHHVYLKLNWFVLLCHRGFAVYRRLNAVQLAICCCRVVAYYKLWSKSTQFVTCTACIVVPVDATTNGLGTVLGYSKLQIKINELDAIQRWSAICRV